MSSRYDKQYNTNFYKPKWVLSFELRRSETLKPHEKKCRHFPEQTGAKNVQTDKQTGLKENNNFFLIFTSFNLKKYIRLQLKYPSKMLLCLFSFPTSQWCYVSKRSCSAL